MFTIEQIEQAHAKVSTGADFPQYIQDIRKLGVRAFVTWVKDSHTEYQGENDFRTQSGPKYDNMFIAEKSDLPRFVHHLKAHQQGKTDYFAFCKDCAETGIEKWMVSLEAMTCTYYNQSGEAIWVESI